MNFLVFLVNWTNLPAKLCFSQLQNCNRYNVIKHHAQNNSCGCVLAVLHVIHNRIRSRFHRAQTQTSRSYLSSSSVNAAAHCIGFSVIKMPITPQPLSVKHHSMFKFLLAVLQRCFSFSFSGCFSSDRGLEIMIMTRLSMMRWSWCQKWLHYASCVEQ